MVVALKDRKKKSMRLIDAEHLKWNVGGIECGEITVDYLIWIIDNQEPTIEAIPLSFIQDEIKRLDKCKLTDLADYMRNVLMYYDAVQRGDETW